MATTTDGVVIGAGIAGISAAHHLSADPEVGSVALVDPRPPLSLTSDKSTECYRNWWPSREMVGLMNRSIDLIEEMSRLSADAVGLTRRGYLFVTADEARLASLGAQAETAAGHGAGPVRHHAVPETYGDALAGSDILTGPALAQAYPYLTPEAVGAVHVRRAGWFSAQQLGAWMLEEATARGATLVKKEVVEIVVNGDEVTGVTLSDGSTVSSPVVVVAAGPMAARVAATAGVKLPLLSELHLKVSFRDHLGVVPRDAPMLIWADPQTLDWSDEEREEFAALGRDDLLGSMPIFCHGRPEGGADSPYFVGLWEYRRQVMEPTWPLPHDPLYPEVVIRGLAKMVPALEQYRDRLPPSTVDGGYYTKTADNRPVIGPGGPDGLYLLAGLSGFGVMAAPGAGDLLARQVLGKPLPEYADAFLLDRLDETVSADKEDWGQL